MEPRIRIKPIQDCEYFQLIYQIELILGVAVHCQNHEKYIETMLEFEEDIRNDIEGIIGEKFVHL